MLNIDMYEIKIYDIILQLNYGTFSELTALFLY